MAERQTVPIPEVPHFTDPKTLAAKARRGETITYADRPYLDRPEFDQLLKMSPEALADRGERLLAQILRLPRALHLSAASSQTKARPPRQPIEHYHQTAAELSASLANLAATMTLSESEKQLLEDLKLIVGGFSEAIKRLSVEPAADPYRRGVAAWLATKNLDYFHRAAQWFEESGLWGRYLEKKLAAKFASMIPAAEPVSFRPADQSAPNSEATAIAQQAAAELPAESQAIATNEGLTVIPPAEYRQLPVAEFPAEPSYFGEIETDGRLPEGIFGTGVYTPVDAKGGQQRVRGTVERVNLPYEAAVAARPRNAVDVHLPLGPRDGSSPFTLPSPFGYRVTAIQFETEAGPLSGGPNLLAERDQFGFVTVSVEASITAIRYRLEPTERGVLAETPPDWAMARPTPIKRPEDQFLREFLAQSMSRTEQVSLIAANLTRRRPVYTTDVEYQRLLVAAPDFYAFQDGLNGPVGHCEHLSLVLANELRKYGIPSLLIGGLQAERRPDGRAQFNTVGHAQVVYLDEAGRPHVYEATGLAKKETGLNNVQFHADLPTARQELTGHPDRLVAYLQTRAAAWRTAGNDHFDEDLRRSGASPDSLRAPERPSDPLEERRQELFEAFLTLTLEREQFSAALGGDELAPLLRTEIRLADASYDLKRHVEELANHNSYPTPALLDLYEHDDFRERYQALNEWLTRHWGDLAVRQGIASLLAYHPESEERGRITFGYHKLDRLTAADFHHLEDWQQVRVVETIIDRDHPGNGHHPRLLLQLLANNPSRPSLADSAKGKLKELLSEVVAKDPPTPPELIHDYLRLLQEVEQAAFPQTISELFVYLASSESDDAQFAQQFHRLRTDPIFAAYFSPNGQATEAFAEAIRLDFKQSVIMNTLPLHGFRRSAEDLLHRFRAIGLDLPHVLPKEVAARWFQAEYEASGLAVLTSKYGVAGVYHLPDGTVDPARPATQLLARDYHNLDHQSRSAALLAHAFDLDSYLGHPADAAAIQIAEEHLADRKLAPQIRYFINDPQPMTNFGGRLPGGQVLIEGTLGQHPLIQRVRGLLSLPAPTHQKKDTPFNQVLALAPHLIDELAVFYRTSNRPELEDLYLTELTAEVIPRSERSAALLLDDFIHRLANRNADLAVTIGQRLRQFSIESFQKIEVSPDRPLSSSEQARLADSIRVALTENLPLGQTRTEFLQLLKQLSPSTLVFYFDQMFTLGRDRRAVLGKDVVTADRMSNLARLDAARHEFPRLGSGLINRVCSEAPDSFWADHFLGRLLSRRLYRPDNLTNQIDHLSPLSPFYAAAKKFVEDLPKIAETSRRRLFKNGFVQFIRRFGRAQFAQSSSGEFHQLRDYQPGDDLKHVDWNATARLGKTVVREMREQNDPEPYHYLVDLEWLGSGSESTKKLPEKLTFLLGLIQQGLLSKKPQALHFTYRGNILLSMNERELPGFFDRKATVTDQFGTRSKLVDFILSINYLSTIARQSEMNGIPPPTLPLVHTEANGLPWHPPTREGTALILTDNRASLAATSPAFRHWIKGHIDVWQLQIPKEFIAAQSTMSAEENPDLRSDPQWLK